MQHPPLFLLAAPLNNHNHPTTLNTLRQTPPPPYLPLGTVESSKYPGFLPRALYCPSTTSSGSTTFMLRSTLTFSLRMSSASRDTCVLVVWGVGWSGYECVCVQHSEVEWSGVEVCCVHWWRPSPVLPQAGYLPRALHAHMTSPTPGLKLHSNFMRLLHPRPSNTSHRPNIATPKQTRPLLPAAPLQRVPGSAAGGFG